MYKELRNVCVYVQITLNEAGNPFDQQGRGGWRQRDIELHFTSVQGRDDVGRPEGSQGNGAQNRRWI